MKVNVAGVHPPYKGLLCPYWVVHNVNNEYYSCRRWLCWLGSNFEKVAGEPLSGEFKGAFKLRIGDWRVVYTVGGKSITVQFIGDRKDILNNEGV